MQNDDLGTTSMHWLIRLLLSGYFLWQGLSTLMTKAMNLSFWLMRGPVVIPEWLAMGWAGLQLWLALWLITPKFRQALWPALVVLALPLLAFFYYPVWINSLGGFPFIGTGQSLLKNGVICALPLWLLGQTWWAKRLALAALALFFTWTAAMAFTGPQASDIAMLLKSSPLAAWAYQLASVAGVAIFTGLWQLVGVSLLLPKRCRSSGAMVLAAWLLLELSMLLSFDDALMHYWLTASGNFLLKDALLLAALWMLVKKQQRP
ncbi:hypothetical protein [Gallaecimonas mangrovi]|uniref:hypothetical protein n=1 Tax=Gallaecimonas mangrovi TaxID=2291597 RepID=UPI000E1FC7E5|nr:hypothetical protein [Gallaecimonas mangrovi]